MALHLPACTNSDYSRSTCCPSGQTCCIGSNPDDANFNQPFCNDNPKCAYCDPGYTLCANIPDLCCRDGYLCCKPQIGYNNNKPFCAQDCSVQTGPSTELPTQPPGQTPRQTPGPVGISGSGASMLITTMWWVPAVHVVLCVYLPLVAFVSVHG